MSRKSKLSTEEKIWIVELHLSGKSSRKEIQRTYGLGRSTLSNWVKSYQKRATYGLIPAPHNKKYSAEIKLQAVTDYLAGGGSLSEICEKYNISREGVLSQWVKRYDKHGVFKHPNNGGAIYMLKGRETTLDERIEIVSFCIANNNDYGQTIEKYNVSYQQIYGWVTKYKSSGIDGLIDRRGKRKDETSMTEIEKLSAKLKLKEAENLRLQMENDLLKKLEEMERGRDID